MKGSVEENQGKGHDIVDVGYAMCKIPMVREMKVGVREKR